MTNPGAQRRPQTGAPKRQRRVKQSKFEHGLIRPVFRTLFWAIIKLKLLLRRIRIRLVIRNAMRRQTTPNTLTIFSGNVNYPIQRRILECI